jgi:predicted permease
MFNLRALFHKRRAEQEMDDEMRFHLEKQTEQNIARGMSAKDARFAALRQFGNVGSVKEECRDSWGTRFVNELAQDLRYGLRQLRRNPGFTAVAIVTLALGIGGTTAIFSVLYEGLLNPWPYKDSGRLAVLVTHDPNQPQLDNWARVSPAEFLDIQEQNHVFDQVIGALYENTLLTGHNIPSYSFWGWRVTPNTFQVLGMRPIIGRTFTADDAKPGAPPVVLLSYKVWQSKFGANPGIVGQTIELDDKATMVIGVMPPRFGWWGNRLDVLLPATFSRAENSGKSQRVSVFGHLKPGVTFSQASADLQLLAKRFAVAYREEHQKGITFLVESITDACVDPQSRRTLSILMAGVGLLLLIACVNIANLLLARGSSREREIAIRAALGAGRLRLVRQLMIESLLLALGGAVLGSLLAWDGLGALVALMPSWYMPTEAVVRMNFAVLLFTAGIAAVSTLLFGLTPAVLAVKKDIQAPLKGSARGTSETRGHHRLRNLLVVSEVVLSLVLLTGAGLLFRSFWTLRHLDLGYNTRNVLEAEALLPRERYKTAEQRNQFHLEALRRVRALPGVVSATFAERVLSWANSTRIEVIGHSSSETQTAWFQLAGDRYFKTLGIPLLAGRTISEEDLADVRPVVVVNRAFVNKYFAGANPLGRLVKVEHPAWLPQLKDTAFEIVGVVGDTAHEEGAEPQVQPQIFLPFTVAGTSWGMLLVRTAGSPAALANPIRREFAALDKELPVDVAPIRNDLKLWYEEPRFVLGMLAGFALLGTALVCIGVYGVLSYAVSQRTQEFGIRMALGAQAADVRRMVMTWGLRWLAVGIGVGVPASIALEKILQNRIWGIKSADPVTFIAVSLILIGVALLACYIPARRAAKVDPMVALRYE